MKFSLHDMETIREKQGNLRLQKDEQEANATYDMFEKYKEFHLNEPLGHQEELPFLVERTHKNNLPVYTDFKMGGQQKRTIIRNITGDVVQFKEELAKIVSNAPVYEKMGRVEVHGLHSAKVKLWLTRLGF